MNRRAFLRRSAMIAAGAVAADQLELLDRLGWVRRFFAGWGSGARIVPVVWDSSTLTYRPPLSIKMMDECFRKVYGQNRFAPFPVTTPLRAYPRRFAAIQSTHYYGVVGG